MSDLFDEDFWLLSNVRGTVHEFVSPSCMLELPLDWSSIPPSPTRHTERPSYTSGSCIIPVALSTNQALTYMNIVSPLLHTYIRLLLFDCPSNTGYSQKHASLGLPLHGRRPQCRRARTALHPNHEDVHQCRNASFLCPSPIPGDDVQHLLHRWRGPVYDRD